MSYQQDYLTEQEKDEDDSDFFQNSIMDKDYIDNVMISKAAAAQNSSIF